MKHTEALPLLMTIESAAAAIVYFAAGQPIKGVYWTAPAVIFACWMFL